MNIICWSEVYVNNIGIAKKCCTNILGTEFHDSPKAFGNHFKISCFSPSENTGYMPLDWTIAGIFFLINLGVLYNIKDQYQSITK